MRELFEGSELLRRARKNGLGWNAIIEVIKFLLVIKAADSLTQRVAWAAYSHGLDRFVSRDVLWLLSIGLIGLVAIAYSLVWEHMRPADVGVRFSPAGKILRGLGCGFAAGAIVMGGGWLIATLLGGFDVKVNVQDTQAASFVGMLLVYLFQSFGEEVMYRGSFMMAVARRNGPWIAVIASSLLFSLHHHINSGYGPVAFINLFMLAAILGIVTFLTDRIWAATAIHAAWNFFQGNVFGVNVSGVSPDPTTTLMSSTAQGNALISGGKMGVEGSLAATLALVVALAVLIVIARRKASEGSVGDSGAADAPVARGDAGAARHLRG